MSISLRSMLIAGVTAAAVSAITVAPVRVTPEAYVAPVTAPVQLSVAVTPITPQEVSSALAEIRQIAPQLNASSAAGDITVQNAASDVVNSVYNGILYWTDYLALELAPYLLGWVPFGGLITDQIYAIYYPIIDFTNSVVYDLIDPVLNDPLDIETWVNGISAVAYSAVASLVNVGINEVNLAIDYFLGWLPPLPPLPTWPLSVAAETSVLAAPELSETALTSQLDAVTDPIKEVTEVPSGDEVVPAEELKAPVPPAEPTEDVAVALPEETDLEVDETEPLPETETETEVPSGTDKIVAEKRVRASEKPSGKISQSDRDDADAATDKPRTETKTSTDTKADSSDAADNDKKPSKDKASDSD